MRVYATTLSLSANQGIQPILATVARWVTSAERRNAREGVQPGEFTLDDLATPGVRSFATGSLLEVVHTAFGASPYLHAIRYTVRDKEHRGRSWVTEVGIRAEVGAPDVECSVYLHVDDVSTRVAAPTKATRPLLIRDLLKKCEPTERTNGTRRLKLTQETAGALAVFCRSTARTGPLIVLSATSEGEYLADVRSLEFQMAGLATVVVIPPTEDTRALAEAFGEGLTPYAGAVTVLYPPRPGPYSGPIPLRRLLPGEVAAWVAEGKQPVEEIFALVTERMNVVNVRRHISPDVVHRERARRGVAALRTPGSGVEELRASLAEAEEINASLAAENERLASEAGIAEWTLAEQDEELKLKDRELKETARELHEATSQLEALKAQLVSAKTSRGPSAEDLKLVRAAAACLADGPPHPEACLHLLKLLFPDRVHILDDAFESARAAKEFREGGTVWSLLTTLVGPYWEALNDGLGDSEARKVFPPRRFAAKESTLSADGRRRRTFSYKGQERFMEPHLKVGNNGGSVNTTLRIHFDWDAVDRVIVIAHCGEHIPF